MIFKKKIFFLILFFILNLNSAKANLKEKLITKIKKTETIYFDFEQKISDKTETGTCIIKYQKLIKCDYNDKFQKRLISNGKTLAVIQKRYKNNAR